MYDSEIELPPEEPRFAYEEAEKVFDAFTVKKGDPEFHRAWMKTKAMCAVYAYADFYSEETHPAVAMARGWEELQMAFTGRAEAFLTGAVLHLWNCLPPGITEKEFMRVVVRAWQKAEDKTPKKATRLYLTKYRKAVARQPEDGFILDPLLPCAGVRLREWAVAEMKDPDEVEHQFTWLEALDRGFNLEEIDSAESVGLRLIPGGKDSQGTNRKGD